MARLPGQAESLPVATTSGRVARAPRDPRPQAVANLGGDISRAGDELYRAFREEQARVDSLIVEDSFTQLRNRQIELSIGEEAGFRNIRGGDAVKRPLLKEWSDKFDAASNEILGKLTNDRQRQAFRARMDMAKSQYTQDILGHLAAENRTYRSQVLEATGDVERQAASLRWNSPGDVMASIGRVKAAVDTYADAEGMDGPVKEAAYMKALSPIHAAVAERAIDSGNPEYAKLWMETHKGEIDAGTAEKLAGAMKVSGYRIAAQEFADEAITKGMNKAAALKEARKRFSDNGEEFAVAELKERFSELELANKQAEEDAINTAWSLRNAGKPIPDSLYAKLPGRQAAALRAELASKTDTNWATYGKLMALPPEEFAKVNLPSYFGELAETERKELTKRQAALSGGGEDEKLDAATLQQQLSSINRDMGWTGKDNDEAGKFAKVAYASIYQEQKTLKRKLSQDERQAVIDRLLIQGKVKGSGWFFDDTKRVYQVAGTEDEAKFAPDLPTPATQDDFNALPKGALYIDPDDGRTYRKP